MRLITFIEQETPESYRQITLMASLSGLANSLLLGIVNHAAETVARHEDLLRYFLLYMISFALFLYTQWFSFDRAIQAIENGVCNVRNRLAEKMQWVDLAFYEKMGVNELYAGLTKNDVFISQSIPQIVGALQMLILSILSFLYLAYISPISFIIAVITISIGTTLYLNQLKFINDSLTSSRSKEKLYFSYVKDLVNGFKEIKINPAKGRDILARITVASAESRVLKINAGRAESRVWGFGRVFIYTLLSILVFIIPDITKEHAADIYKITATMLFITGPITVLLNTLPLLNRVDFAIDELYFFEAGMDQSRERVSDSEDSEIFMNFQRIEARDMVFVYPDTVSSFQAGPFSELVKRGEILFVIGGNGSGKSTFLKLLTGLYQPARGGVLVDGHIINSDLYLAYRKLFSIIFTDFYLFQRFYGLDAVDPDKVRYWLERMQISDKVTYKGDKFSTTALSTGQRKRLAFIAAILEDKPILVIDEFAADQDPPFRKYFYETLLAELKAAGKTVVAVTHDDAYFHVADRVLKMDCGRFIPYQ